MLPSFKSSRHILHSRIDLVDEFKSSAGDDAATISTLLLLGVVVVVAAVEVPTDAEAGDARRGLVGVAVAKIVGAKPLAEERRRWGDCRSAAIL